MFQDESRYVFSVSQHAHMHHMLYIQSFVLCDTLVKDAISKG